jgi:hypothetical protein
MLGGVKRFKSKFKADDRVVFVCAGNRYGNTGAVVIVRPDGLLVCHFDADPPNTIRVTEPGDVLPAALWVTHSGKG